MKKTILIVLAVLASVLLVYGIYTFAKKSKVSVTKDEGIKIPPVVVEKPTADQQGKVMSREIGDGALLFQAYLKKFSQSPQDVAEATKFLDAATIFDGTNDKAWRSRFLKYNMQLPPIPTTQQKSRVESLAKADFSGGSLWDVVDRIRAANQQLVGLDYTNFLPGNPQVDSNAFVDEIMCAYTTCPGNDKKRNDAANAVSSKVAGDFQTILKNVSKYNTAATLALEAYTIEKLNQAGFKVV